VETRFFAVREQAASTDQFDVVLATSRSPAARTSVHSDGYALPRQLVELFDTAYVGQLPERLNCR